ncbi:MAG: hypothetical protein JST00_15550 [Deltaproteobacteria bacterium]|nr:hypothetical protein [Deltaproteobacteria bacterium]
MWPRSLLPLLALFLFGLLPGCFGPDSLSLDSVHDLGVDGDSNVVRVAEGDIFVVRAKIIHPEIEGSAIFDVDELTADAPSVIVVTRGASRSEFVVEAVGPGETVLRGWIEGKERAVRPIKVAPRAAPSSL